MKDWKVRQEIFHRLTTEYRDDLNELAKKFDINIDTENIVERAIEYFYNKDIGWYYPSKSYVVGICYAKWLEIYFGENFIDALSDADLLYGNDPYFFPYAVPEAKVIYDKILLQVGNFDDTVGKLPDIKKYFLEEFLLNEDGEPLAN